MERSFGTKIVYFGLKWINGRIKKIEILIIYFVIHTANAVQLGKSIENTEVCRLHNHIFI